MSSKDVARELREAIRDPVSGIPYDMKFAMTFDVLNDPRDAKEAIDALCKCIRDAASRLEGL